MDTDEREDYQRQKDDERRMAEEEAARYLAAHPLADKCRNHPEREAVDPLTYDRQFCAECVEVRRAIYANYRPPQLFDDGGISAWIHGAGDRPSNYFTKDEPK